MLLSSDSSSLANSSSSGRSIGFRVGLQREGLRAERSVPEALVWRREDGWLGWYSFVVVLLWLRRDELRAERSVSGALLRLRCLPRSGSPFVNDGEGGAPCPAPRYAYERLADGGWYGLLGLGSTGNPPLPLVSQLCRKGTDDLSEPCGQIPRLADPVSSE